MTDQSSNSLNTRSWLERLSHALSGDEPQNREQLLTLLRDSRQRNLINDETLSMIEGSLLVSEMRVRDIMIPRSQMVVLEGDANWGQCLPSIIESAHSRFPVMGETRDEVLGILLVKDLLVPLANDRDAPLNLKELLRPAVFVPESKRLNQLLQEFRTNRNHMAIVVDEYGGVAGLVTIEDVLEQIVGDIADEHDFDDEDLYIKKHSETLYTIKALVSIEEFNEFFSTQFSDDEFDTIAGLVMSRFGHMPQPGETIEIKPFNFKVLNADSRRIHLLEMSVEKEAASVKSSQINSNPATE